MRITTNAILRNYRSNLGTSMANLNTARNKVMTGRQFVSSAENPGSALRAATLERKYAKNLIIFLRLRIHNPFGFAGRRARYADQRSCPDFKQAIWSGSIKWHQCRRRDTKNICGCMERRTGKPAPEPECLL